MWSNILTDKKVNGEDYVYSNLIIQPLSEDKIHFKINYNLQPNIYMESTTNYY